jgi:hypothetical protein
MPEYESKQKWVCKCLLFYFVFFHKTNLTIEGVILDRIIIAEILLNWSGAANTCSPINIIITLSYEFLLLIL